MKRLSTILLISMAVAFGLNTVIPVPLLADVLISAPPPLAELLEEGLA